MKCLVYECENAWTEIIRGLRSRDLGGESKYDSETEIWRHVTMPANISSWLWSEYSYRDCVEEE